MAYVIARKSGGFEIRESLHTPRGPRARTLAGFRVLTDETLAVAAGRAQRPFDAKAVIRSGRRAGAVVSAGEMGRGGSARERFLAGSRRMARSLRQSQPIGSPVDPGTALEELLGFADTVMAAQHPRRFEALQFPPLSRLGERGQAGVPGHAS